MGSNGEYVSCSLVSEMKRLCKDVKAMGVPRLKSDLEQSHACFVYGVAIGSGASASIMCAKTRTTSIPLDRMCLKFRP